MVLVVAVQEGNGVVNIRPDGWRSCQAIGLGGTSQCIDLLVAGNGITSFISPSRGAHVLTQ